MQPLRSRHLIAFALLLGAATPLTAHAGGSTIDNVGPKNEIGARLGITTIDRGDDFPEALGIRTDIHGQYNLSSGLGMYLTLPISHVDIDGGDSETALGNIDLGVFYAIDLGPVSLTPRLGVFLPTAGTSTAERFALATNSRSRLTDQVLSISESTGLRASATARANAGLFHAQLDVGVDLLFFYDAAEDQDDTRQLLRVNAMAGFTLFGLLDLDAELANVGNIGDGAADESADNFRHTLALTATLNTPVVKPYLSYATPLDDRDLGDLHMVTAGARFVF